jgi:hypothetical protein
MKTCAQIKESLPGLLYGELAPAEAEAVHQHLAGCPPCRGELAGLRRVRALLEAAPDPAPDAEVDLTRLYREAARRQTQRLRRWRRLAAVSLAVAAGLLGIFALKLEVQVDGNQFVLRWGPPPPPPEAPRPGPRPPAEVAPRPPAREAELELIKELVHLLAADVQTRDREHKEVLDGLRERLDALRGEIDARWAATERDVAALYTAQFGSREKGDRP